MAGVRYQSRFFQYSDDNGDPLAGGSITFYESGTSDLEDVYTDDTLGTPQENPIDLDADGRLSADVFLDPSVAYRAVLKDSSGTTIADDDPVGGADVTAAIEAHDVDTNAHYAATESQRGFVELASQSEVNTGTDALRAVTPATLAGRTATETRVGLVELATTAEAAALTDTTRAITAAGLASILGSGGSIFASTAETLTGTSTSKSITPGGFAGNKSLSASGYYKFPGGFIIQWGQANSTTDDEEAFTFPTAFTTACYGVIVQRRTQGNEDDALFPIASADPSTTQFKINRMDSLDGSLPFYYLAWGV